ncbi:MAG: hypothetical protein ABI810_16520 [Sphingomonas bacterium]
MNDDPIVPPAEPIPPQPAPAPTVETVAQQAVERAEAAATRRRWVTLAEVVGIAGLLIAAASLWMSWSDHRADQQEKQVEKASEAKVRTLVLLTAKAEKDGKQLALKDSAHEVQSIDVRFPASLGISAQSSVLDPRIEAGWFADPILALTHDGPDKRQGRLPVLITSNYWDADQQRSDSAIYDVVWFTEGSFMGVSGRSLRLKGILLRERTASPARLEATWAKEKPEPAG